MHHRFS